MHAEASVRLLFDDGQPARPLHAIAAELEERRRNLEDGIAAAAAELATINRMLPIASEPVTLQGGTKLAPLAPVPPEGGPPPASASEQQHASTPAEPPPAPSVLDSEHDAGGAAQDEPPPEDEAALEAPEDASEPAPADASPGTGAERPLRGGRPRQDPRPLTPDAVLEAIDAARSSGTPATASRICGELGFRTKGSDHTRVSKLLRRMEDDAIVRRVGNFKTGAVWDRTPTTPSGRADPRDASPGSPSEPSPVDELPILAPDQEQHSKPSPSAAASPPRCWCTDQREHPRCPVHHAERSRPATVPRDASGPQPTSQGEVLSLLQLAGNPMTLAAIADALSQPRSAVEVVLRKLVDEGELIMDKTTRRYEVNRYA